MADRLAGKVAVVTGGAKGQGEGVARRFAAEGARVAVLDVLDEPGTRVAAAIGGRFFHCDVAREDEVAAAIDCEPRTGTGRSPSTCAAPSCVRNTPCRTSFGGAAG